MLARHTDLRPDLICLGLFFFLGTYGFVALFALIEKDLFVAKMRSERSDGAETRGFDPSISSLVRG